MKILEEFNISQFKNFKFKLLKSYSKSKNFMFLDSNNLKDKYDWIFAVDCEDKITCNSKNSLFQLNKFYKKNHSNWIFGSLSYDLKNHIEILSSSNYDGINFPLLNFFVPKFLFVCQDNVVKYFSHSENQKFSIEKILNIDFNFKEIPSLNLKFRISKNNYFKNVSKIIQHINLGDIYEMNYCQEIYAEKSVINPYDTYLKLVSISKAPFSSLYRHNNSYLISASPERFIKKIKNKLFSQPIKGTIRRSENKEEDNFLKMKLFKDDKERSENVMIVDLVRNDLSKIARRSSVNVDELFGIYSFNDLHHMISTISCDLKKNINIDEIISSTFPMGSMTGAPKYRAMELIEKYEKTKRGLYSGSIGYIEPNGDFDFNVIIRSIQYNQINKYLSILVGGAITSKSKIEKEFDECLLKSKSLFKVLNFSHD